MGAGPLGPSPGHLPVSSASSGGMSGMNGSGGLQEEGSGSKEGESLSEGKCNVKTEPNLGPGQSNFMNPFKVVF